MSNLEIWYKRINESKYHKITNFVNRSNNEPILSFKKDISNKLQEFEINLYNPIDEDSLPIFPQFGDSFAITDFQNNIFNNTFFGINISKDSEPIGITDSEDSSNWVYKLTIKAPNFSTQEITLDYSNSVYINDILPIIFNNTPSLGGILSNGYVIPKHNYGGENLLLPPPKFQGEQFDALVKILDMVGWTFSYYYYSELNSITGLHIIKQIDMFPKNFLRSAPSDWQDGFKFSDYKNGLTDNPDYPHLDDNKYILGENKISLTENGYSSKNAIKLKLFIKNSTGEGTKKIITSSGVTDTYNIGGAFEIKSIAIKVFDENGIDVKVKTVTSTTVFTVGTMVSSAINFYQQRLLDNGLGTKMRCKIISSSIEYFSDFTINNSTQTITLDTGVTGLSVSDTFELVNCYDLLRENLTGYPPSVNGYIIKKLDNEQSTITFTEYDRPERGKQIVIYYYPITQIYKTSIDNDNIAKTGYRGLKETIKESVTLEQAEEIFNEYLKLMKPLKQLIFSTSHRKSILDINTLIPVNFGTINQNLIVTEVSGKILSNYGFYRNKPLIIQDSIVLASYKNNIDDILLKIQNQSMALDNMNLVNNIQEFTNNEMIFEEIRGDVLNDLITPIMLDATNILSDRFTMNFTSSNTDSYRVLVGNDIDFVDKIVYNLGIPSEAETLVSADLAINDFTYPIWIKIQAIRGSELSLFSNIKLINLINTDLYIDSYTTAYYDFQNNYNSKNNTNHASGVNSPSFVSGILTGDTYSLQLDGINQVIQYPNAVSVNNDITVRVVKKWDNFTRTTSYLHCEWYGLSGASDYIAKIIIVYNKSNNKFEVTFYNYNYSATNTYNCLATESSTISLNTTDKYLIQLSWNNTTQTAVFAVNGTQYTLSKIGGSMDFNTLNLKDSISPKPVYYGAYTYPNVIDTSLSPACKIARLVIDNRARTFVEHQADYALISPKF